MSFFDNGNPEEFLLFVWNFKITLNPPGMLADNKNLQYICTLVHVEALRQVDTLCAQMGSMTLVYSN